MTRALALCFLFLLSACATGTRGPRPLSRALLEEHAGLASDDHPARARFAYDLGLGTDAVFHASRWLEEAQTRARIREATSASRSERNDAARDLKRAIQMALETGHRFGDGNLVIDAVLAQDRPKTADIAWGCAHAEYWNGDAVALLQRAEGDPEAWLAAWSLFDDWSVDDLADRGYSPSAAILRKLDVRGNDVRWALLDRELATGALSQRAIELAATIAAKDPSDARARILLELRDAMKDGAMVPDADLFADQGAWATISALSRARRRSETFIDAPAATLHYAQLLLSRGLSGDAIAELERGESKFTTDTQRDIAALLEALALVRTGDPTAYDTWRKAHDDAPSLAADRSLARWRSMTMEYGRVPEEDTPLGAALQAALVRRVDLRDPELSKEEMVRTWSTASRRERSWIRDRLGNMHPIVERCLDRGGEPQACAEIAWRPWQTASWAVGAMGLDHRVADELLKWVVVSDLDASGWAALEAARDTTLALSSSFTSTYVRALVERGDLEGADAWLKRFGGSLSDERLAGLQLTVLDRMSGREDGMVFAAFTADWPSDPNMGSEIPAVDPRAPWPIKVRAAEALVYARQLDDAEALYVELAEGAPAPARTLLLGLAARAAFEAGRDADATGHLATLPADDLARAEVQALLDAKRGDQAGARAQLLQLWPRRRSAGEHVLALGVSMQTEPGIALFVEHGTLAWSVRDAVRRGSIVDLSTLSQMEVLAQDPSGAWDAADTLVPELLPTAIQHGNALLQETTRRTDARPIATKLVALYQREADPPREPLMELMLLTGQHAEALSMARSEVPEQGVLPLPSTHGLVRLHEAGQGGTASEDTLWHEWRWRAGLGALQEHEALLDHAQGPLVGYACILLSDSPRDPRALPTCKRAWEAEKRESWQSAVNYSYLLLREEVPPPGTLAVLFETTPPPPYQPSAPPVRDREDVAILQQNLAVWLSLGGEDDRAAQARIDSHAYARFDDAFENQVDEAQYAVRAEHAHAGTLAERDADGATLYGRLAYQALRGLRPARARHYAAVSAALPERETSLAGPLGAGLADALAPLLADDLEAGRAPHDVLGEAVAAAFETEGAGEVLEPALREHPDAVLLQLLMAQVDTEEGRHDAALERLKPLEAAHPTNPLVAVVGAQARLDAGDPEAAKGLYARALAARPDSALLRHAELPEAVVGARPGVPAWMRSSEGFDRRLQAVSTRDMMDLIPRYQSHTEVGADGFFPLGWTPRDAPLSAESPLGEWVSVEQDARASRCVGVDCLRPTLDALKRRGYTEHFVRTTQLPAGEATEAALSDATNVWLLTSIPVGGRVFTILGSASHGRAESLLTAFALLRRTVMPLDAVVHAFAAASLRADGSALVDRSRLKARLEAANAEGEGCPARTTLAQASPTTSAEILLDLYLASAEPNRRDRVLACAEPGTRAARRLALVTLLDDDARLHAWGRAAVSHHASRAIRDTRHLIPMEVPLSAPDYFDRSEAGPRGRVELGLALPEAAAKRWVAELLASPKPEARVDAWVIAAQRPEVGDVELAARTALDAQPGVAYLAFDVLEHRDEARYAATVRARFDALDPDTLPDERLWETRALGYGLVELADPVDGPRLKAAAKRWKGKDSRRKNVVKTLERFAKWHAEARAPEQTGADPFSAAQRAHVKHARTPRTAETLAELPLASLLPTRHWMFARVASPGLFASTVLDLTQRLDPGDPTQRLMVDSATESMRESSGFDALLEGGGLDLSAPIECASMAGDSGFVCSATVRDRDALLTELGRRGYDSDAGLSIVLQLSKGAGMLPVGLSILPALLHELVYEEDEEDEEEEKRDPKPRRYERLRHQVTIAGHRLDYYAIIEAEEGSVGTDAERYLFVGDRILVFSNDFMARRVLFEPDPGTRSLGDDPEFLALTRDWKDGSALQAAAMGLSSPIDDANVASEVVADGKGIAFLYSATTDAKLGDMTRAEARLPPGSVSTLVVGYPEQDEDDIPELTTMKLASEDVVPPIELLLVSAGAAFGWYPAPGDSLWEQWVLVLPLSDTLRRSAAKAGARGATATAKRSAAGWWYGQTDGMLVLASNENLGRIALERPSTESRGAHLLGRGTFDGARASEVVARLPTTAVDLERMVLRFFAGIIGLVEQVGFEATWDPATRVGRMHGRISLRLRDRDDSEVVDQWLAAARFRNAAALPRTLDAKETQGTLRFALKVADAQAFADQSVFPSARVSTRMVDDTHVELTVRAKARDAEATEVLDEGRKKALLDTSDALRIHDPSIEAVRDSLTDPSMDATAKATKITAWVHERIAYEVTPRSLDATEILEVGRGDCSEYARLSVALLRAAGVPAEVRSGMAAQGGDMVAHAWVAYHDGTRWHEVDPTWGRMKVTAGHLPLEVTDVLALVSLGQLEIERIEAVR